MSRLRQLCAVMVLSCVLSGSAFAGDIHCGVTGTPPPPPQQGATATVNDETSDGVIQTVVMLLQGVLSVL